MIDFLGNSHYIGNSISCTQIIKNSIFIAYYRIRDVILYVQFLIFQQLLDAASGPPQSGFDGGGNGDGGDDVGDGANKDGLKDQASGSEPRLQFLKSGFKLTTAY